MNEGFLKYIKSYFFLNHKTEIGHLKHDQQLVSHHLDYERGEISNRMEEGAENVFSREG
jgi:hypothetical protein